MEEAILEYYRKAQSKAYNHCQNEDFSNAADEITAQFQHGKAPVRRNTKTNFTAFRERFGYELPHEIQDYINLFWHSFIIGWVDELKPYSDEAIVLFSVIKNKNENDNDVLFHKHGLMHLAEVRETYEKDIDKYIPVGWLHYCGADVLYEVETGNIFSETIENGVVHIADSLAQLISKLNP